MLILAFLGFLSFVAIDFSTARIIDLASSDGGIKVYDFDLNVLDTTGVISGISYSIVNKDGFVLRDNNDIVLLSKSVTITDTSGTKTETYKYTSYDGTYNLTASAEDGDYAMVVSSSVGDLEYFTREDLNKRKTLITVLGVSSAVLLLAAVVIFTVLLMEDPDLTAY